MTPADPIEGLPLAAATPPRWVEVATSDLDALLADHAHCELKAASTAMSLVGRFADRPEVVDELTALAHEEIRHFERVHALIRERGGTLPKVGPDRYVRRLKQLPLPRHPGTSALLDALVLCGFVEARSCERFRLLAGAAVAEPLRKFYAELAAAESRHHETFFALAGKAAGEEVARARIREVAALEAVIIRELPLEPRIH